MSCTYCKRSGHWISTAKDQWQVKGQKERTAPTASTVGTYVTGRYRNDALMPKDPRQLFVVNCSLDGILELAVIWDSVSVFQPFSDLFTERRGWGLAGADRREMQVKHLLLPLRGQTNCRSANVIYIIHWVYSSCLSRASHAPPSVFVKRSEICWNTAS